MLTDWPGRTERRVADLRETCRELRTSTAQWFSQRRSDERFFRFLGHFEAIESTVGILLDRVDCELAGISADTDSGVAYDRCRAIEEGVLVVRRMVQWYAQRYDQRLEERRGAVLAAADEVVRSCWTEPFVAVREPAPAGPLVFVDPRWGACANLRTSVPLELRGPADGVLVDLLAQLPVPTIALPPASVDGAWWLVLAAHETAHHVFHDVDGLEAATTEALAASLAPRQPELVGTWLGWATEVFADAYATVMIGGAAAWGIGELEYGPPARLTRVPEANDRYPPPSVRLALVGELARHLGTGDWSDDAAGVRRWLAGQPANAVSPAARITTEKHLAAVPHVAAALAQMPFGHVAGTPRELTLREVPGTQTAWFTAGGRVMEWADQLRHGDPALYPQANRPAARLALAAGVAVYRELAAARPHDGPLAALHRDLVDALRRSGPAGVLAPAATARPVRDLAERFADRLFGTSRPATALADGAWVP